MRELSDQRQAVKSKIIELQQSYVKLRKHLFDLKAEKRTLIEQYDADRHTYASWLKRNVSQ